MKRSALLLMALAACSGGGGSGGTRTGGAGEGDPGSGDTDSPGCTGEQCAAVTAQPHLARSGGNLLANPALAGTDGWSLESGAVYDASRSRTAGSGSVRITAPYPEALVSDLVPVEPHRSYVFSAFVRTDAWPNLASMFCSAYDGARRFKKNLLESKQATAAAGEWQEVAVICRTEEEHAFLSVNVLNANFPDSTTPLWVDDLWLGEGLSFEQPPAEKVAFEGTQTRVDALGNFEVWDGNAFQPFVPFCIATDNRRDDWSVYAAGGFNCNIWAPPGDPWAIRRGRDAGLMTSIELGGYINANGSGYRDLAGLRAALRKTVEAGLNENVLMYYFDNETYQTPFADLARPAEFVATACDVMETVAETERELNGGKRLWPRYMLMGNEGMARMYDGCVDVVGDYISWADGGVAGVDTSGLLVLDNIEGQSHPRLAQINAPQDTAASFRAAVYSMLIAGARGFSYWRDVAPGEAAPAEGVVPIEQAAWYAELPTIKAEIARALPVLRHPHWTSWSVASSGHATSVGTRDHEGEGYLIVVHDSDVAEAVTFTVSGLPYTPVQVEDYFTGGLTPASSSFTLTLAPHATGIYRLRAPAAVR